MLTGLSTMKSDIQGFPMNNLPALGVGADEPFGQNFMCLIVHNHISHERKHKLRFIWMAPQKDTGCISFLATATLGHQVLFKDTIVMQLCEEGAVGAPPPRPTLTTIHENGIIFRDDFDSMPWFNSDLWSICDNIIASTECGVILHGQAAVACRPTGPRVLITVPLNLTSAAVVQYTIGIGECTAATVEEPFHYYYSHDDNCMEWTFIETTLAPMSPGTSTFLQLIPAAARRNNVCLKWEQKMAANATTFTGCWAMDNFFINNLAGAPRSLQDNFDPVMPENWMFFPGGEIKHKCHAENHAMVFRTDRHDYNYLTSRELDLTPPSAAVQRHALLGHDFEHTKQWFVQSGKLDNGCGTTGQGLIMAGKDSARVVCSPQLDLTQGANLRFYFGFGVGGCRSGSEESAQVVVYTQDKYGNTHRITALLPQHYMGVMRLVSLDVPAIARRPSSKICWLQKRHSGQQFDVWTLDGVTVLPHVLPSSDTYVQFSLTLHCGKSMDNSSIIVEYSTDHGQSWQPLYTPCLPDECQGQIQPETSVYRADEWDGWDRITEAVPSVALTPHTRFRWRQLGQHGNWAVDNVFVGSCEHGCNGRGACTNTGCVCDFGFAGPACDEAIGPLPTLIIEAMNSISSITTNFGVVRGAALSYQCGVVGSGKAVVFNKDGLRMLQTVDVNTTNVSYLQFSVRVGSASVTGSCPPPDSPDEVLLVQYTCTGGVEWTTLHALTPETYSQPKVLSLHLPAGAHDTVCRFRWWQPRHSGYQRDVWAVDDVALTDTMYNTISLDFTDPAEAEHALDMHLGEITRFCDRKHALSFTAQYQEGEFRYVMTNSMQIGPSYMLQLELVLGCRHTFLAELDNRVYLEYSTDHGMSWSLVREGCWPPALCEEYHAPSEYHAAEFQQWKRVTLLLPAHTW